MIDISIIIPTFNRLWSLPKAIESCKSNHCILEIIIIDDGSEDGTWEWLKNQEGIIRIRSQNWGKCWAVNEGFKIANGKYVKFLDSDDMINTNALDEQFILAEKEDSDVVVSGYKLIDDKEQIVKEQVWVYCDDFIAQQLGECDSSHYSSYLFKKEFIAEIPHRPDFAFRDDRLFVLEVALKEPKISFHTGYALLHSMHARPRLQSTSNNNKIVQNIQHMNIYRKITSILKKSNSLNFRRINASTKVLWDLVTWMEKDNLKEAQNLLNWIYELNPDFVIPMMGAKGMMYKKLGLKNTSQILKIVRLFK